MKNKLKNLERQPCRDCNYVDEDYTRWRSSSYSVSDEQQKERFLGKGGTLARGEDIKIG